MKKYVLLALILAVILAGCSAPDDVNPSPEPLDQALAVTLDVPETTANVEDEFNLDEYKVLVAKCNDDIMELSILLSNMGQYEYNYWKALGRADYDSMVSKAFDWLEEKAEVDEATVEAKYQKICDNYKGIIAIDVSGAVAQDARSSFKELFESFDSLYLLVTSPSGSMPDFASKYNTYSNDIKNINSNLSLMVSTEKGYGGVDAGDTQNEISPQIGISIETQTIEFHGIQFDIPSNFSLINEAEDRGNFRDSNESPEFLGMYMVDNDVQNASSLSEDEKEELLQTYGDLLEGVGPVEELSKSFANDLFQRAYVTTGLVKVGDDNAAGMTAAFISGDSLYSMVFLDMILPEENSDYIDVITEILKSLRASDKDGLSEPVKTNE